MHDIHFMKIVTAIEELTDLLLIIFSKSAPTNGYNHRLNFRSPFE